jgi:hypothetical protein
LQHKTPLFWIGSMATIKLLKPRQILYNQILPFNLGLGKRWCAVPVNAGTVFFLKDKTLIN